MTITSRLKAARVRLSDLGTQRDEANANDDHLRRINAEIAATEVEVESLTIAEADAKADKAIAILRTQESSQVDAIVKGTQALQALLTAHTETQRALETVRTGAGAKGVIQPLLRQGVAHQITAWARRQPELVGLPALPTRGEERLADARIQLASAEKRLVSFDDAVQGNARNQPDAKRRIKDEKRYIEHNKAVVAWAKQNVSVARPAEPRPVFRSDPDSVVRMGTPDRHWLAG